MNGSKALSSENMLAATALLAACVIGLLATTVGALALAVPLLLMGGILLFARPVIGLLLFTALVPLESALMIGGRSFAALIGAAVFGVWALRKLLRREPLSPLISPGLVQVAGLLLAWACLSLIWAAYPELVPRRLVMLLQLVLLCVLVLDLVSSWERVAWVAKLLVLAGTVAAFLTVDQYFSVGMRRAGEGVVGGINRTAVTLVTLLPFAFYLLRSREPAPWRLLGLCYIGLAAVAVAATLSRMNYLLFPAVVAIHVLLMARSRTGRRRLVLLGAVGVIVFTFLPMDAIRDRAESIAPYFSETVARDEGSNVTSARGYHLRMSWALFRENPVVGVGYDNYRMHFFQQQWLLPGGPRVYSTPQTPHNSHLAFLATLGIVGFGLWVLLFVAAFRYTYLAWRGTQATDSSQAHLIQAVTMAIGLQFIYGMYAEVHQDKTFWMLLGLAAAMYAMVSKEKAAVSRDRQRREMTAKGEWREESLSLPRG